MKIIIYQYAVTVVVALAIVLVIGVITMSGKNPRCYIDYIYIPALDKSLNSTANNNIILFTLKLVNPNIKGVKYDDVHISFGKFVGPNAITNLGNTTVKGFYQGCRKTAFKRGSVVTVRDLITPFNGKVVYRVNFTTTFPTKHCKEGIPFSGGANIEIGHLGLKVYRKPVKLGHYPPILTPY